ncbi:MAG: M28 family peptidase [Lentimicrobium sp.]|nr:M28 family peptidase [Lentimicrobium sp.]HPG33159.1 M28 family peptidase [Lentimicrobium sp.]
MNLHKITVAITTVCIILFTSSCGDRKKTPAVSGAEKASETSNVFVPEFNADSAYAYIERQLEFGPRVPNTAAHRACAQWLESSFKRFTPDVIVQKAKLRAFDGTILDASNIIAQFNPDQPSRVLLCAHWDSRPWADHDPDPANHKKPVPAANDGASGVGVLLEIARQMSQHNPGIGVDIVLFDAEDYGEPQELQGQHEDSWGLGSQYWSKNPHIPGYMARYGILLDMVGAEGATFTMEGTSMYFAPDVMRRVWNIAHRLGYDTYFSTKKTGAITDDHLYVNDILRIPTIDIIDYDQDREKGFFKYWHTVHDDMSNISKETLKAVGHTVITAVYETK